VVKQLTTFEKRQHVVYTTIQTLVIFTPAVADWVLLKKFEGFFSHKNDARVVATFKLGHGPSPFSA
jgi:hypothetical protein